MGTTSPKSNSAPRGKRYRSRRSILKGAAALFACLPGGGLAAGEAGKGGPPTWSYTGSTGPMFWGSLSPDHATCATGRMQSPIEITDAVPGGAPAPVFDYRSTPLTIVNTGYTVQVNYAAGSTLTVAGRDYELLQFHFHTPAEHVLAGMRSAMEVHFVHRSASGALAVVGVMMRVGRRNEALAVMFANLPTEAGQSVAVAGATVDASAVLPRRPGPFFQYEGSLTTPPCSEGVLWIVPAETIEASAEQVAAFRRILGPNARPLQAPNGRLLKMSG